MKPQTQVRFYVVAICVEVDNGEFTYNSMVGVHIEPTETEKDALQRGKKVFIEDLAENYGIDADDINIAYIDCLEITANDLDPNTYD